MTGKPDAKELQKPVPEGFDNLVKALLDIKEGRGRHDKRGDWNMGRHIAHFMDANHRDKYGRCTMEQLGDQLGYKPTTLYTYANVYRQYASDKALLVS